MAREYQLFVDTDGSITIKDPVTRKECSADGQSGVSEEIVEMLDEARMI